MKILLSGFEPFGLRTSNKSWEIAKKFIGEQDFKVIQLPVSFANAHKKLIEELSLADYDVVLMLGETAATKDAVRLERVAINYKDAGIPDNDGLQPDDEVIIARAPNAYFTGLPVKRLASALIEKGHKVRITNSAGTYVCNSVYYNILHFISVNRLSSKALFVHLPASDEFLSDTDMQQAVTAIVGEFMVVKTSLSPTV